MESFEFLFAFSPDEIFFSHKSVFYLLKSKYTKYPLQPPLKTLSIITVCR